MRTSTLPATPKKGETGSWAESTQPLQTEAIMPTTVGSFGSL